MKRNVIVPLKSSVSAKATLIWLPHSGGSAAFFQSLSNALPESVECLSVEYSGRGRRIAEPLSDGISSIVDEIVTSYNNLLGSIPVVLFGHSLGARVGYELCRRLRTSKSNRVPHLLVVSACEPLHIDRALPIFHRLPDDRLIELLLSINGIASADKMAKDLLLINLRIIRADLALSETHRFTHLPVPNQNLTVFAGNRDQVVRHETLSQWQDLSSGKVTSATFEGGHFYMLEHSTEFLARLVQVISDVVDAEGPKRKNST